jgi:hypothetical protein
MEPADALLEDQDLIARVPTNLASLLFDAVEVCLGTLSWLNDEFVAGLVDSFFEMLDVIIAAQWVR